MNRLRHGYLIVVTLFLIFSASPLIAGDDGAWKKHFDAGNDAYKKCNLAEAENQLRKALAMAWACATPVCR